MKLIEGQPVLDAMFDYQSKFMAKEIERLHPDGFDLVKMHHSLCSHMISECQELMDCEPWYFHKRTTPATKETTVTEMVDVWKWLMNLMHVHKVTPAEFTRVFCEKSTVVESRIKAETFARGKPGPMLVLDLDGVLADRDTPLLKYACVANWAPECKGIQALKDKVGGKTYEKLKQGFYQNAMFDMIRPIPAAVTSLNSLKGDVPVLILTARPVKKHARLHFQTIEWLHRNGIQYDALVCMDEKGKALASWCDERSIFLDDEQPNVNDVATVCDSRLYRGYEDIAKALIELKEIRKNAAG